MSIWIYEDTSPTPCEMVVTRKLCLFCEAEMEGYSILSNGKLESELGVCNYCGWWCRNERHSRRAYDTDRDFMRDCYSMTGAFAQLRNLDLSDITIPLEDLRRYLIVKFGERFHVNPQKLEELVASVFRNHGYHAEVTAFQNDGGIDVILSKDNKNIGVQVKRYKNRIEAEQIRSLAGALLLGGYPSGVFVTTSIFRSGAISAAEKFESRGVPIKLMDAPRFYDALNIRKQVDLTEDNIEEFIYNIQSIGESKVIYENEFGC